MALLPRHMQGMSRKRIKLVYVVVVVLCVTLFMGIHVDEVGEITRHAAAGDLVY